MKCPPYYWPNVKQDFCFFKEADFLSFEDSLGAVLTVCAISLSLVPLTVLTIFVKFRQTPIVKANNRSLSYFILVVLTQCFLSSMVFIGYPNHVTCLVRQPAFGLCFSMCVSSVLAKTIMVVLAFRATKPGSFLRQGMGRHIAYCIVFFSSLGQAIIIICWLSLYPPFPELNIGYYKERVIPECNEGSKVMFHGMLGYQSILASVCFIVAFMVRKLPDCFNEAQFITFSMITFLCVWLSFIPAYLSTKGKYVVVVEIFAILSSACALLVCIFIPKCYIIVLKPELNTREGMTKKDVFKVQ
ncbi:vomeronasal type-2 receptor 26-like [Protopterus annectens]|uniref:vomeronasal type-2 receptor 26-like n=1 Tax=Protopterus annectens TaxID=7888 RepID=UPI001CF9B406|nr:vomeronasal type-2 receptor 26-like [Protopterus annectens]